MTGTDNDAAQPMVRCGRLARTQAHTNERAGRGASGLAALGVRPGERIALVLRNDLAFLEILRAAQLAGVVPVPANWHWGPGELRHVVTDSGAVAVFAHSDLLPQVEAALPDGAQVVEVAVPADTAEAYGLSPAQATPSGRHLEYEPWLAAHDPWTAPPAGRPTMMLYTSGTTGQPKGVLREAVPDEQVGQFGALILAGMGLAPGMRTLVPAPLYHAAPAAQSSMALLLGVDLTVLPRFDAEGLLATIAEHRIDHVQVVPTMLVRLLRLPEAVRRRYDLRSLRVVVHGAAPCPPEVKRAAIDWLGPIVHEYYGATEAGVPVACTSAEWLAHPGTVGRTTGDAQVRILGPDDEVLPPGATGRVFIKPWSCLPQFTYHGDPAKRAAAERDGFITVGDVGHLDDDRFLYLTGRSSDMVISGGVNIYPVEIEHCLLDLPGVADAAVFGIPDVEFGEALAAHVQLEQGSDLTGDAVRAHVRAHLAGYKVPKVVVFDPQLPREDTGKIFKGRLRERYPV